MFRLWTMNGSGSFEDVLRSVSRGSRKKGRSVVGTVGIIRRGWMIIDRSLPTDLWDCDHHMGEGDGYEDLQQLLYFYVTAYRRLVNISSLPRSPMPQRSSGLRLESGSARAVGRRQAAEAVLARSH